MAWSRDRESSASVSVPPWSRIPPPSSAAPPLIVRPEMSTVADADVTSKTRLESPASTSSRPDPGPAIVRPWAMASSPLVRWMVEPSRRGENWTVSPGWAAAIAARSVPAPSSARW